MRREGYIIEEIIEYSNMSEAFDSVLRGTDRKRSRQGRFLLAHREKIITELTASIADGSFRLGGCGIRYTVMIGGHESFLFNEDEKWFVEAKEQCL